MRFPVKSIVALTSLIICGFILACNDKPAEPEKKPSPATNSEAKQLVFDKLVGLWKSQEGKSF